MEHDTIQIILWCAGASIGVTLFAKYCPKQKILNFIKPPCVMAGALVSKTLLRWLPRRAAEKIEEGVIVTVMSAIGQAPLYFIDGLLEDNKKRRKK